MRMLLPQTTLLFLLFGANVREYQQLQGPPVCVPGASGLRSTPGRGFALKPLGPA